MLTIIREKIQGVVLVLIVAFLAVPFAIFGINSYFEGGSTVPLAEVNGVEISEQTYRERLSEVSGIDPSRPEAQGIKRLILDSIIDQTLLVSYADEQGYRMSDSKLGQLIRELPYFQSDGAFDPEKYRALLRQRGMRPADFETKIRQESVILQVQRGFGESAFVTDADVAALARLLKQQRRVSVATLSAEPFLAKVSIAAPEIEEFYQANQESFRTEESVRVEYVTIKAGEITNHVRPTEEELRELYNAEIARYTTPEKRVVAHILINVPSGADEQAESAARLRAEDLAKQLRTGANFAALAKQHSDDKDSGAKGGDLGEMTPGLLPAELEAAVKALKLGEVTAPVRTRYGFHLVKLTAHQPEQRRSFEAVKAELAEQVRRRKGEERFYELTERLRNLAYEHPEGLQPVAKELGLELQTSDWFTRQTGSGIAAAGPVRTAAFDPEVLARERNSDVIEVNAETMVALRVAEHRPSVIRPLAEVRPQIERMLKERRAAEQARALAQEWVQKFDQGAKLGELARAAKVGVQPAKTITREDAAGVDRRVVDAVFAAPRPGERPVAGSVDLGRQGVAVFALEAVRDADVSKLDAATKEKLRRQLVQRRGTEYFSSYRAGLRQTADVTINSDQL